MSAPVYNDVTLTAQAKDAGLWGLSFGTTPSALAWQNSARIDNVYQLAGFTAMTIGRKHTKYKLTSPPESWERNRAYVSFYTSGFKDAGYVQNVKLRLYVQDAYNYISDTSAPPSFSLYGTDWTLVVYTVSGGYHALHREYLPGDNPSQYGFGDSLRLYDADLDDYIADYDDWGEYAATAPAQDVLEEYVTSGQISVLSLQSGVNPTGYDVNGNLYRWRGWIELDVPIDKLNLVGETHLRLMHYGDKRNAAPETGPNGHWNHHEYITVETQETSRDPQLVITYVTPGTDPISSLRLTDLSVHRHIETKLGSITTYSGLRVLDGFPQDMSTGFDKSRNVSLEHVASRTDDLELGSRKTEDVRKFFVDIVCDKRGELQDLQEKVQEVLQGSTKLKDFRYGFGNPPDIGNIQFRGLRVFNMPNITDPDRELYHAVVSVDAHVLRSG